MKLPIIAECEASAMPESALLTPPITVPVALVTTSLVLWITSVTCSVKALGPGTFSCSLYSRFISVGKFTDSFGGDIRALSLFP